MQSSKFSTETHLLMVSSKFQIDIRNLSCTHQKISFFSKLNSVLEYILYCIAYCSSCIAIHIVLSVGQQYATLLVSTKCDSILFPMNPYICAPLPFQLTLPPKTSLNLCWLYSSAVATDLCPLKCFSLHPVP